MPADDDPATDDATPPGADPPGRDDTGRSWPGRLLWLMAAVGLALAAGALLRAVDDDLAVDDADLRRPVRPAKLAEAQRWHRHRDLDQARAVAPDPNGGVWVATDGGLVRWDADGDDYTRHATEQFDAPRVNPSLLAVTPEGVVWAATDAPFPSVGADEAVEPVLLRYDGTDWTDHADAEGLPAGEISQLVVGPEGAVWAVTPAGVARFADGAWTRHTPFDTASKDLGHRDVERLVVGSDAVWALGDDHQSRGGPVARFDGQAWRAWHDGALGPRQRQRLAVGADGRAWLVVHNEQTQPGEPTAGQPAWRLLGYDNGRWTTAATWDRSRAPLKDRAVADVAVDRRGAPWLALRHRPNAGRGEARNVVARYDGNGWTHWRTGDALPAGRVEGLTVDATGTVWAPIGRGPDGRGVVSRFADGEWTTDTADDGLPEGDITELVADGDTVWAASTAGVARFHDGQWTRLVTGKGPATSRPSWVAARGDEVWVAGRDGVSRWRDGSWTTWTGDDGLAATAVALLAVGSDGVVWAGTVRGVSRFADGAWTSWTADDGLAAGPVMSITVEDRDTVWATVLTRRPTGNHPVPEGALARYDGHTWTTWADGEPLQAPGVRRVPERVAAADSGRVWVVLDTFATSGEQDEARGESIARFDGESWQRFTADDGLPEAEVNTLTVQDTGAVWAGTDDGIARFDGTRWATADTDGNPLGLTGNDPVADESVSSIALGPGDTVWAATNQGVSQFDGHEWRTVHADQLPGVVEADPAAGAASQASLAVGDQRLWLAGPGGLASIDLTRYSETAD